MSINKIGHLIREYLLDEGLLKEKIPDPDSKFEFGLIFAYPSGEKGHRMQVIKLKDKDSIILSLQTQMPKSQANAFSSLKDNKKGQFFTILIKYFVIKEIYFKRLSKGHSKY